MNDDGGVVLVEVVGGHESKLVLINDNGSIEKNVQGGGRKEKVEDR